MAGMTSPTLTAPAAWAPPAAARTRGTLAVIAGRTESPAIYERFGRRLASDGYHVAAFEAGEADAALAWLSAQDQTPRVLVGSDAGAAAVLRALEAGTDLIDGAIIAGTPVDSAAAAAPEERTACPLHLGVLSGDATRADTVDLDLALPTSAELAAVTVPVLAAHGESDPVAPVADAHRLLSAIPRLTWIETVGGLHDALNDASHRSVAAHTVLWLERLRAGDVDSPIVRATA